MRRRRGDGLGSSLAFAELIALAVLSSRSALAAPSARLTYVRAAGAERCADEEALRRAVAARIGYDPFFPWARLSVVTLVRREAGGYKAEVTLVDDSGVAQGTRAISAHGDDCAPLVGALALTISLALDAQSLASSSSSGPSSRLPEPPAPKEPAPPPAPPPTPFEPVAPPPVDAPRSAPPPAWHGFIGLAAALDDGLTPAVSFGLLARARFRRDWFSLGGELGGDLPTSASVPARGSIEAWTLRASVVACGHISIASACAFGSAGLLSARGEGIDAPKSAVVGYGLVGPRVGVAWPLSPRFAFEAFGQVGFVVGRRSLEVGGGSAFQQAVPAPSLGLGVSTRIF